MKKRDLTGLYFRIYNQKKEKWEATDFMDLSPSQQKELLEKADKEWIINLTLKISECFREVADELDIYGVAK
jgi:hypothetical protein